MTCGKYSYHRFNYHALIFACLTVTGMIPNSISDVSATQKNNMTLQQAFKIDTLSHADK